MKILIIKLGAKGDVIRTLPILVALKEKYPESEIYWITKPQSKEILDTIKTIDKVLTIPCEIEEKFDILYNFDIEKDATNLAQKINADKKYGFYEEEEFATAFNIPSEDYLNTLFDDELKKENRKTYQEMMFQAAELPWKKQHHPIYLTEQDKSYAKNFIKENKINTERLIGIHIGSSPRWPSKSWHEDKIIEFIKEIKKKNYDVLLFTGPDDKEKNEKIINKLVQEGIKVYKNNPENSDLEFVSLINSCKSIICSDSFALHVSLASKKPTIGLFFCTSPYEVEDYDLLKKIVSPNLYNFFPEKMDKYSEELVNSISVEEVLKALEPI